MKAAFGPTVLIGALVWAMAADAQSATAVRASAPMLTALRPISSLVAAGVAGTTPPSLSMALTDPAHVVAQAATPLPSGESVATPIPATVPVATPVPATPIPTPVPAGTPVPTPVPAATLGPAPVPAATLVPAGQSAATPVAEPIPSGSPGLNGPSSAGPPVSPGVSSPGPAATSATRAHLHRPGTDVDADVLTGSLASNVFVLKGNVTLRSDPKIDREVGTAVESDEPLTVTADEIDIDKLALTYVAKGHVHFVQGERSGRADVAMLDEQKHTLDLVGNADVLDGDHRTAAAKMHYNTFDKRFLGSGDVRIYEPLPTPDPNATPSLAPKRKRRFPI